MKRTRWEPKDDAELCSTLRYWGDAMWRHVETVAASDPKPLELGGMGDVWQDPIRELTLAHVLHAAADRLER